MKILSILSAGLIITGLTLLSIGPAGEARAGIVFDPPAIDLGNIKQGSETPFRFTIRNHHSYPVTLRSIATSCGCTLVNSPRDAVIKGGSSLTLSGVLDSHGKRGATKVHAAFDFRTGGAERERTLLLVVRAHVEPTLVTTPDLLEFELPAAARTPISKQVEIHSDEVESFRISSVSTSDAWLSARVVDDSFSRDGDRKNRARLQVIVDPDEYKAVTWEPGRSSHWVSVATTAKEEPRFRIPIGIKAH